MTHVTQQHEKILIGFESINSSSSTSDCKEQRTKKKRQMKETATRMSSSFSSVLNDLSKEQSKSAPDSERCQVMLHALLVLLVSQRPPNHQETTTRIASCLSACQKSFRLQRRQNISDKTHKSVWDALLKLTDEVLIQSRVSGQRDDGAEEVVEGEESQEDGMNEGNPASLPKTVAQYAARLKQQGKELHKTPPALPPGTVTVYPGAAPLPKRDPGTGRLNFVRGQNGDDIDDILKEFTPNTTPEEILRGGAFGGTYFRSIQSAVTNRKYNGADVVRDTLHPDWYRDLDVSRYLTSPSYDASINRYRAKCGGSLDMWESSGWIADADPYGWFQWYCRFYQGRRSSDDARQIGRWKGVAGKKGRFKSQLCNRILAAAATAASADGAIRNETISPVIRQTLFHWGLTITKDVLDQHKKR
jgi:hypothetical protein